MGDSAVSSILIWNIVISLLCLEGGQAMECYSCHYLSHMEPDLIELFEIDRGQLSCQDLSGPTTISSAPCGNNSADLQQYCLSANGTYTFKASLQNIVMDITASGVWRGCVALPSSDVTPSGCRSYAGSDQDTRVTEAVVHDLIAQAGDDSVTVTDVRPVGSYCLCTDARCNAGLIDAEDPASQPADVTTRGSQVNHAIRTPISSVLLLVSGLFIWI